MNNKKSFGKVGDKYLKKFYKENNVSTTSEKLELYNKLLGPHTLHAHGCETDEMRLGCYEYHHLISNAIITVHYC